MSNTQNKTEQITKESIDKELLEKALVDDKILKILEQVELVLIIVLVAVMIYLTYTKIRAYLLKKRKEEENLLDLKKQELERDFYEKQKNKE